MNQPEPQPQTQPTARANQKPADTGGEMPTEESKTGKVVIISGPSGVGKTSVLRKLFSQSKLPLVESVSATTRSQRPGETAGRSYHYLSEAEFEKHRQNNDFLEYCEVFGYGHWYGTLRQPVSTGLEEGNWIILEVDVEGAAKVLKTYPDAITIFIHPGSIEELERRLRGRGTESEEVLKRRLEVAKHELDASSIYRHIVTNQSVEQTVNDICELLEAERN